MVGCTLVNPGITISKMKSTQEGKVSCGSKKQHRKKDEDDVSKRPFVRK
jgi:hypothetical protein